MKSRHVEHALQVGVRDLCLGVGMAAAAEDQHQKRTAAAAYDYDADPRWADYWSNVLVPSHLAARPEVLRHFKLKFYQRYVDPDLIVEPLSAISSPRSSPSEPRATSQRRSVNAGDRVNSSDGSARSSPTPSAGSSLRMDRQSIQFLANAWVTVMALLAMFPFLPYSLVDKAYRLTFLGTAATCVHAILNQHGMPSGWNLQSLQIWLQSVLVENDFLYLLYSVVFVSTSMPIKVAVVPVGCRSLEQVVYYLRRNFSNTQLYKKYLDKPCSWVATNSNLLKSLTSNAEIGVGVLLLVLLLTPQRNIIQAFVHWNLLKLMYHIPTTAPYHRSSWSAIGRHANPLVQRYAPFLGGPIGFAQRWFNA